MERDKEVSLGGIADWDKEENFGFCDKKVSFSWEFNFVPTVIFTREDFHFSTPPLYLLDFLF
ncbi:MAG: hypothetical protein ACO2PO_18270 [Candidatus Calescibacterium sp.]